MIKVSRGIVGARPRASRSPEPGVGRRVLIRADQVLRAVRLTTTPWPGPGDSEGPVDPEAWTVPPNGERVDFGIQVAANDTAIVTTPWPGPGDSEG